MKQFFAVILGLAFISFFSGCTGMQLVRSVDENNVFISSGKPNIKIKVQDRLKYKEQSSATESTSEWSGVELSTRERIESFIFQDEKVKTSRLVITLSRMTSSSWIYGRSLVCSEGALNCGRTRLGGQEYQYATYLFKSKKGNFLSKTIARRLGANKNAKIELTYREEVGDGWSGKMSEFNDKQLKTLKQFNKEFYKKFEIL